MNEKKKKWIKELDLIIALVIALIVLSHLHDFANPKIRI